MIMVFSEWNTDKVEVYRTTMAKVGNITKPTRAKVGEYRCRVYNSQKDAPIFTDRQPKAKSVEKLWVEIDCDIVSGDELMVTRGFYVGGSSSTRYLAGDVVSYYEPVGGMFNGLKHKEVAMLTDEVIQ